eukprot:gnl/TRDRNA2_/TRDRNA2_43121_c0_seq1.p1 gnl/TRDRNA2_/TRDRNA2_43121_c0~~gnl/TRDRNA2_/TRDRNA2_43121_c0_seq1.p1  ORF type:complete len:624 (+),score=75.82 gnl/TRDRNA2_/TRDRNA2_43121_c0_seq1:40-1911(+)
MVDGRSHSEWQRSRPSHEDGRRVRLAAARMGWQAARRQAIAVVLLLCAPLSRAQDPEGPPACHEGFYQHEPIVFGCHGGSGKRTVMLSDTGTPHRLTSWHVPVGTENMSLAIELETVNGGTGGFQIAATCIDSGMPIIGDGGPLDNKHEFARIAGANWSWSGGSSTPHYGPMLEFVHVHGRVACNMEFVVMNSYKKPLAGVIEFGWSGVWPCPDILPGCRACPKDVCHGDEIPVCDGSPSWECQPLQNGTAQASPQATAPALRATTVAPTGKHSHSAKGSHDHNGHASKGGHDHGGHDTHPDHSPKAAHADHAKIEFGCCFSIGFGNRMKPCCLSIKSEKATETACAGNHATHVGGALGWRVGNCPKDAEEGFRFIREADEKRINSADAQPVATIPLAPAESPAMFPAAPLPEIPPPGPKAQAPAPTPAVRIPPRPETTPPPGVPQAHGTPPAPLTPLPPTVPPAVASSPPTTGPQPPSRPAAPQGVKLAPMSGSPPQSSDSSSPIVKAGFVVVVCMGIAFACVFFVMYRMVPTRSTVVAPTAMQRNQRNQFGSQFDRQPLAEGQEPDLGGMGGVLTGAGGYETLATAPENIDHRVGYVDRGETFDNDDDEAAKHGLLGNDGM